MMTTKGMLRGKQHERKDSHSGERPLYAWQIHREYKDKHKDKGRKRTRNSHLTGDQSEDMKTQQGGFRKVKNH